jgi:hypothetical protein
MHRGTRWISLEDRLWRRVDKSGDCWLWTGACDSKGYGHLGVGGAGGKTVKACRVVYELTYGPIPKALCVLHKCDNPLCVRPDHLFLGTQTDNLADMTAKGRRRYREHKGSENGRAKLSESHVLEIRKRAAAGELRSNLAEEFSMCWTTIDRIVKGHLWQCLQAEEY